MKNPLNNLRSPRKALASLYPKAPTMADELAGHIWTIEEIARLIDHA